MNTYHLYHADERSEFTNRVHLRHQLLSKTAQIFFRNNLDRAIYHHFRGYMTEAISWKGLTQALIPWLAKTGKAGRFSTNEIAEESEPLKVDQFAPMTVVPVINICSETCNFCQANNCQANQTISREELSRTFEDLHKENYQSVIFPANFELYGESRRAAELAKASGLKVIRQISQAFGFPERIEENVFLEVLLTEAINIEEWHFLSRSEIKSKILFFTFVPTSNVDAFATIKSFPEFVKKRMRLFCPPANPNFLCADELFGLIQRIRAELPQVKIQGRPYFSKNPIQSSLQIYHQSLDQNFYIEHFSELGKYRKVRSFFSQLRHGPQRLLALPIYYSLLALRDPGYIYRMAVQVQVFGQLRWTYAMVRVLLRWRILGRLQSHLLVHAWGFRQPEAWLLKYAPWAHGIFIYPFKKVYYFSSYQVKTRLLNQRGAEFE